MVMITRGHGVMSDLGWAVAIYQFCLEDKIVVSAVWHQLFATSVILHCNFTVLSFAPQAHKIIPDLRALFDAKRQNRKICDFALFWPLLRTYFSAAKRRCKICDFV